MEDILQICSFLAVFIIIAVASDQISRLFPRIKLPLVTGLLVMGIITGPYVMDLITQEAVNDLDFINDFALAFIALTVGAELYLRELRSRFRSITAMTISQLVITFILGSLAWPDPGDPAGSSPAGPQCGLCQLFAPGADADVDLGPHWPALPGHIPAAAVARLGLWGGGPASGRLGAVVAFLPGHGGLSMVRRARRSLPAGCGLAGMAAGAQGPGPLD